MKDFAKLKAYHLYETETAIEILEECINLSPKGELQAKCKLMLGDITSSTTETGTLLFNTHK